MSQFPATPTAVRYGSAANGTPGRRCPVCSESLRSARARYCSVACKQRAYRRRQPGVATFDPAALPIIYECGGCGERLLGEQRCEDCNRFCRALGPGGPCPHCDEPILLADLLEKEVPRWTRFPTE